MTKTAKLTGRIERVDVGENGLAVSGWIEPPAAARHVSLLFDDREIARLALVAPAGSNRPGKTRQPFAFHTPLPMTLTDVRALRVAAPPVPGSVAADRRALAGKLPLVLSLDDVVAEANGEAVGWRLKRRTRDDGRPRILFDVAMEDGAVNGLALDVAAPERVLSISVMSGAERLAEVEARERAEVEASDGVVKIDRGFFADVPPDRMGPDAELWFGLGGQPPHPADDAVGRAIELIRFHEAPAADDAKRRLKASLIVVAQDDADALRKFLEAARPNFASLAELIVVDASFDDDVAEICRAHATELGIKRIAAGPFASLAAARNAGARAAVGDVLVFCDLSVRMPDDVLAALCGRFASDDIGAAGVRMVDASTAKSGNRDPHIRHLGVHLRATPGAAGLRPYAATAEGEFAGAAELPICVPAVDAAFLACRASVFDALGGFDETLADAVAAADLCLRVHAQLREVVAFNDMQVVCLAQRAAAAEAPAGQAAELMAARRVRRDLLDSPGYWIGRLPRLGIVAPAGKRAADDREFAEALATAVERVVPARVRVMSAAERDVADIDTLIVLDPTYDIARVDAATALFTAFAWIRGDAEAWNACPVAHAYHGAVAASDALAGKLAGWDLPIEVIPERNEEEAAVVSPPSPARGAADNTADARMVSIQFGDPSAAATVAKCKSAGVDSCARAFLGYYRRRNETTWRFAIKVDDDAPATPAVRAGQALARALRRLGHAARLDVPDRWRGPLTAGDDCVIAVRGSRAYQPHDASTHLLWVLDRPDLVSADELQGYDHVLAASAASAKLLRELSDAAVSSLAPAVEAPATLNELPAGNSNTLLVVGDAERGDGDLLASALALGFDVSVWGRGWDRALPALSGARARIALLRQPPAYGEFEIVYIPIRRRAQRFGLLPQAAFEAVAAGARVVLDRIPDIDDTLAALVGIIEEGGGLDGAVGAWRRESAANKLIRLQKTNEFRAENSYSERARVIVHVASRLGGRKAPAN